MAHLPESQIGTTAYERVMGHAPHVLEPWTRLEDAFFRRALLPAELLEQVRRTLALAHGCAYCRAKGGPPDAQHDDERTTFAVHLAQKFAADHTQIDAATILAARGRFTDGELVELLAFIGFMWAGGTFGRMLGIEPPGADACPIDTSGEKG